MLAGLFVSSWLITGPKTIGHITFDVDTLAYAMISVLLGLQAILIGLFAKVFAISEGLLPSDAKIERFFSYVNLENSLLVGVVIFLLGLGFSVYAVGSWRAHHFGPLDSSQMLRLTLPSAISMTFGFQVGMASFFLGLLRLKRKP